MRRVFAVFASAGSRCVCASDTAGTQVYPLSRLQSTFAVSISLENGVSSALAEISRYRRERHDCAENRTWSAFRNCQGLCVCLMRR
jgi:hypothetical protein